MKRNPERIAPASRIGGFTLLEVVIALALTSLVALLGAMLVRTATDYYARGNLFLDDQEQSRQIARLFKALGAGLAVRPTPIVGQPFLLEFVSEHLPLGMNLPGRQNLRLQCEPDPDGTGDARLRLVLRVIDTRVPLTGAAAGAAATTEQVVVAPTTVTNEALVGTNANGEKELYRAVEVMGKNLKQCSFGYLRADTEKSGDTIGRWEEAWLDSYGRRPLAIRLTLESARSATPPIVVALLP